MLALNHDDVIKWKHFSRYWPFVRRIHRSPVNSPCKGQWRGSLMFSLICVWLNGWVNNREAGDLRRYRAHCDVTVMSWSTGSIHLRNVTFWRHVSQTVDELKPKLVRKHVVLRCRIIINLYMPRQLIVIKKFTKTKATYDFVYANSI